MGGIGSSSKKFTGSGGGYSGTPKSLVFVGNDGYLKEDFPHLQYDEISGKLVVADVSSNEIGLQVSNNEAQIKTNATDGIAVIIDNALTAIKAKDRQVTVGTNADNFDLVVNGKTGLGIGVLETALSVGNLPNTRAGLSPGAVLATGRGRTRTLKMVI